MANPLLLSILCLVHRKDVDLPKRRADLYKKCVDVLIESWRHEWRKEQGRDTLDPGIAAMVVEPLAWHLHVAEKRDADQAELVPVVQRALELVSPAQKIERDPTRFLEAMRCDSGLVVSAEPGRYEFLHLTFQEYLAARHALTNVAPRELAKHYGEPWWSEAILLAAGLSGSEPFMQGLLEGILANPRFPGEGELNTYLMSEALVLPSGPLVKRLRSKGSSVALLVAILRHAPDGAELEKAATSLLQHTATEVRAASAVYLGRHGASSVSKTAGRTLLHDVRTGLEFAELPAGVFEMGGRMRDELPRHRVELEAFLLARTPVTNAQYARFLEATKRDQPQHWSDRRFNQPEQPVVGVSWDDAQAYCVWAECTLPSEAQWEYACRAGTMTEYWSGDAEVDLARVGWYSGNSEGRLHAVAEKEANPWGLHDMHGNVWEWCADHYSSDYSAPARVQPLAFDEKGAQRRVSRGGSWWYSAEFARSAFRFYWHQANSFDDLGFRPAKGIATS